MRRWIGYGLCVLTLGVWVLSVQSPMSFRGKRALLMLNSGCIVWITVPPTSTLPHNFRYLVYMGDVLTLPAWCSWPLGMGDLPPETRYVHVPLWVFLALFGVPTCVAWWKSRRYPPGGCQACGYDLTGNVSGTCPECGTAVDADAVAKHERKQD